MNENAELEVFEETPPVEASSENESLLILMDELKKSPSPLAQTVINELKALQQRYVILRLDRDNWRKDFENEKSIADRLYDCIASYQNGTYKEEEVSRKRNQILNEYTMKRRGLL